MNIGNKRPVETFSVVKAAATTIPVVGTLYGSATPLTDGQIGFVAASSYGTLALNTFTDATPTVAETPVIQIAQGLSIATPATYPLWDRPFLLSNPIDGRTTITVTRQAYRDPAHAVWIIGDAAGDAGEVNVLDNTEYRLAIGYRGRRIMEQFSKEQAAYLRAKAPAADFTELGYSDAQAIHYILTYIGWEINRSSRQFQVNARFPGKDPIIAFLIDESGATGVLIGDADPIVAGDVIPVVTTSAGNLNITLTEAQATSIKNAALAKAGGVIADLTWSIVPIDLSDLSGATNLGDMLMIMALDEVPVYDDNIPHVKVGIEVFLTDGFDSTVENDQFNDPDEGQGLARQLELEWRATQQQRMYSLDHKLDPVINFPSPFVSGEKYVVYRILHGATSQVDLNTLSFNPFLDAICIPRYETGTTPHSAIALVNTALNAFLASTTHNNAILAYD